MFDAWLFVTLFLQLMRQSMISDLELKQSQAIWNIVFFFSLEFVAFCQNKIFLSRFHLHSFKYDVYNQNVNSLRVKIKLLRLWTKTAQQICCHVLS